ncbi:MAG: endolytic transglycosylase MltG [bacterium]|nr:endolytic transglycosylase MltG [bacterium]
MLLKRMIINKNNLDKFWSILCLLILIGIGLIQHWYWKEFRFSGINIVVNIPSGATTREIARILKSNGLIKSENLFLFAAKLSGREKQLKPGTYTFSKNLTMFQIIDRLYRSLGISSKITFYENTSIKDYIKQLQKIGIDSTEFIEATKNIKLLREFGIEANSAEGYLFPDTYYISSDMSAEDLVRMLLKRFKQVFTEQHVKKAKEMGFSLHEIVTLASIIGAEVKEKEEAYLVSSVFHNRLKRGIPLQACPTIQYIIPDGPRRLLLKDLRIDSPYNTYLYKGLPPGPIGNPGKLALDAVLNPAKTNYLFFVSQGDGTHAFNETIEGHLQSKTVLDSIRMIHKIDQFKTKENQTQ